jgi:hypothetical protein
MFLKAKFLLETPIIYTHVVAELASIRGALLSLMDEILDGGVI